MNWQIKYALAYFNKPPGGRSAAEHLESDLIKIETQNQPDVLAAVSPNDTISLAMATHYIDMFPQLDFLCGLPSACVWEGDAIEYLEQHSVGWGSLGTLGSAVLDGNANTASHKTYAFCYRLLRQYGLVREVVREFDRIYHVRLKNRTSLRIGMIAEYEPTADAVRSLWDRFGKVDIMWNINPNGNPTPDAVTAGSELGCEVVNWGDLKDIMKKL